MTSIIVALEATSARLLDLALARSACLAKNASDAPLLQGLDAKPESP